jgi:hypothetical protein
MQDISLWWIEKINKGNIDNKYRIWNYSAWSYEYNNNLKSICNSK